MIFRLLKLDELAEKLIYFAIAIIVIALLVIIFYPVPGIGNKTTDKLSSAFSSKEDKISFLKDYINLPTEVEDCEYHIIYYAPSGISLGATEWSFKMMFELKPDKLEEWLSEAKESETGFDLAWVKELPKFKLPKSEAKHYRFKTGELTVFEKESIVFWNLSNIADE